MRDAHAAAGIEPGDVDALVRRGIALPTPEYGFAVMAAKGPGHRWCRAVEPEVGIEPTTCSLRESRSATELLGRFEPVTVPGSFGCRNFDLVAPARESGWVTG